ncbi:MAG: efflux RND transporter periplasmic adaptor subunit [Ignavibacteriales bacterium]|nr:efflux RND transporter periplasmic adaptor subunit [Ignavibacteriales bacterium]
MKTTMNLLFLFALGLTLISGCTSKQQEHTHTEQTAAEEYYTCPMHPSVRSNKPGACPVCGMALVKKSSLQQTSGTALGGLNEVTLSPTQRVMANVSTIPVERKTLENTIQAVGVIDYAEPNYRHISMRFPGRLEKLYVNYTGQKVKQGDPVADVYSPEAISAQREYLLALESTEQGDTSQQNESTEQILTQSKQKLLLWDFTEEQVAQLKKTRQILQTLTIHSPIAGTVLKKNVDLQHYAATGEDIFDIADLSTVWVYLDVYEKNMRAVKIGQQITISTEAYPNESFNGRVTFIDPVLNGETRTVRVRAEFPNPAGKLKPNMYVSAHIGIPTANTLVVPTSAVLMTGKRNVVWVEVKENTFEPREVVLGTTTDSFFEVLAGLHEGEKIAVTGGFLIDSESTLQQPSSADPHAGHNAKSTKDEQSKPQAQESVQKHNH